MNRPVQNVLLSVPGRLASPCVGRDGPRFGCAVVCAFLSLIRNRPHLTYGGPGFRWHQSHANLENVEMQWFSGVLQEYGVRVLEKLSIWGCACDGGTKEHAALACSDARRSPFFPRLQHSG